MFREMRRKERQTSGEAARDILAGASYGVIAMTLEDGYPYALPVSHLYFEGAIYFHGANAGQKYEVLAKNPKVCFTATVKDEFQPGKFTTYFRSAVAFGRASLVEDEAELGRLSREISRKYEPNVKDEAADHYAHMQKGRFCFFKITVEHLTGKTNEPG